jgi:alkylated DNA nucleotide flippase Atl1
MYWEWAGRAGKNRTARTVRKVAMEMEMEKHRVHRVIVANDNRPNQELQDRKQEHRCLGHD